MNSGGRTPADVAVNPQMGEPRGNEHCFATAMDEPRGNELCFAGDTQTPNNGAGANAKRRIAIPSLPPRSSLPPRLGHWAYDAYLHVS
jgi:hypothetical protein